MSTYGRELFFVWQHFYSQSSSRSSILGPPPKRPLKKLCLGASGISLFRNMVPSISCKLALPDRGNISVAGRHHNTTVVHQFKYSNTFYLYTDTVFCTCTCNDLFMAVIGTIITTNPVFSFDFYCNLNSIYNQLPFLLPCSFCCPSHMVLSPLKLASATNKCTLCATEMVRMPQVLLFSDCTPVQHHCSSRCR